MEAVGGEMAGDVEPYVQPIRQPEQTRRMPVAEPHRRVDVGRLRHASSSIRIASNSMPMPTQPVAKPGLYRG